MVEITNTMSKVKFEQATNEADKLCVLMYCVVRGFLTGDLQEIKAFIQPYLTKDNLSKEFQINQKKTTALGWLFSYGYGFMTEEKDEYVERMTNVMQLILENGDHTLLSKQIVSNIGDEDFTESLSIVSTLIRDFKDFEIDTQKYMPFVLNYIQKHLQSFSQEDCVMILAALCDDEVVVDIFRGVVEQKAKISFDIQSQLTNKNYYEKTQKGKKENKFLKDFPQAEIWRLFVDGDKQCVPKEKGWQGYEKREPGCIEKMYNAWQFVLNHVDMPVDLPFLLNLHKIAADQLSLMAPAGQLVKEVFGPPPTFGIKTKNLTLRGFFDNLALNAKVSPEKNVDGVCVCRSSIVREDNIESIIKDSFTAYENAAKETNSPSDILKAILKMCKMLEVMHIFSDGNCRTLCVLLLNKELLRHGFSPVVLDDPNKLEGFSHEEFMEKVIQGMDNFIQVKERQKLKNAKTTLELYQELQTFPIPKLESTIEGSAFKRVKP